MDIVLQYVLSFIPTILALIGEVAVIAKALSIFKKIKETDEYKQLMIQNKLLMDELAESKRLNKELLTKIDHIKRGE